MAFAPVQISSGLVEGIPSPHDPDVVAYLGVPYAGSTAGPNRWRPPQSPTPWDGVRKCSTVGPVAPQRVFEDMHFDDMSEADCLNLNVWTPVKPGETPAEPLAVYVWFYGGRFVAGAGSERFYDGTSLASKGIVVVTLNYRVGILGFLASPELDQEGLADFGVPCSGNYGMLDQLAALKWVQANISAFGGDPSRVTIGGQSAGGASAGLHLLSPLSKGLFHAAAPQAGKRFTNDPMLLALAPAYRTKGKALRQGAETIEEKGCKTIAEMRALPLDVLLEGNNKNEDIDNGGPPNPPPPPFYRPCVDGHFMVYGLGDCLRHGTQNDVPVLTGHNADEGGTIGVRKTIVMNDEEIQQAALRRYGPDMAKRFYELYPAQGGPDPDTKFDADPRYAPWNAQARNNSRITVAMWAEQFHQHAISPVYGYFFDKIPPQQEGGNVKFGAHHGAELPYMFDNFHVYPEYPWTDVDRKVAKDMSAYWVNFIRYGNPNGRQTNGDDTNGSELPYFPPVSSNGIMRLGEHNGVMKLAETPEREVFCRGFLVSQSAW